MHQKILSIVIVLKYLVSSSQLIMNSLTNLLKQHLYLEHEYFQLQMQDRRSERENDVI